MFSTDTAQSGFRYQNDIFVAFATAYFLYEILSVHDPHYLCHLTNMFQASDCFLSILNVRLNIAI